MNRVDEFSGRCLISSQEIGNKHKLSSISNKKSTSKINKSTTSSIYIAN